MRCRRFGKITAFVFTIAGFLFLLALNTAQAQTALQCEGETQRDFNKCTSAAFERADAELNELWSSIQKSLDDSEYDARIRKTALKAQRAWLVFRDAHCDEFLAAVRGGTGLPQFIATCMDTMTRERIASLRVHFD